MSGVRSTSPLRLGNGSNDWRSVSLKAAGRTDGAELVVLAVLRRVFESGG